MTRSYTKVYPDPESRRAAQAHYRWLTALGTSLRAPELVEVNELELVFGHVKGRHARPGDLMMLAAHLGDVHGTAYARELHQARLGRPYQPTGGPQLASFPRGRAAAAARELRAARVPGAELTAGQVRRLLTLTGGPAAFYKDANPRNFLITGSGLPVTVDFDDLTLAPFGYDLAKLVVTLAMAYGALPPGSARDALAAYNTAAAARCPTLPDVSWDELMNWAEIHHILTSRYTADGRYPYRWDTVRPGIPAPGGPAWR